MDEDDNGKFRLEMVKALKYFCINHGDQRFLKFEIAINVLFSSFCFICFIEYLYVMGLRLL